MKRVQKGNSMVAKTAFRIEGGLDFQKNFLFELLRKAEEGDHGKCLLPDGQGGRVQVRK